MAENVIGRFTLPFAVCPDVLVDGVTYQVPMVTEEPSVVAAASYASKLIKRSGGFTTTIHNRQMIGQVALFDAVSYTHLDVYKRQDSCLFHFPRGILSALVATTITGIS